MRTSFRLRERYDAVWQRNRSALEAGGALVDPYLRDDAPDPRRGFSLVARLSGAVAARCRAMLDALVADEPGVFVYPDASLHVTIQSLFRVQDQAAPLLARAADYVEAVRPVLLGQPPFSIEMHGITASRDTVLLQGYPTDATLDVLRGRLRRALRGAGLADAVDERFRYAFAHASVARYRVPLADPKRHVARLERFRNHEFGTLRVETVEAVETDWYMTPDVARVHARFDLDRSDDC